MDGKNKLRVEIIVDGVVQGVGFRYFILRKASELKVKGFVKNLDDGRVLIVAEGEKHLLEDLIKIAKVGPRSADVTYCNFKFTDFQNEFNSFEVKY